MARETAISFQQVAAAADQIKATGSKPTARAVRNVLGTGSMSTVLKNLQQWQTGQMRSNEMPVVLPSNMQRALVDFIEQEVSGAKTILQSDLLDAQQANADLILECERQASTIETQAEMLDLAQVDKAGLAGRLVQIESDLSKANDTVAAERHSAETARVELAKTILRLEAMPRIEAEIEKIRIELLQSQTEAAELHEAAAVALARLEAETAARIKAEQQLDTLVIKDTAIATNLEKERVELQACHVRLEAAAREIRASNEAVSEARAEAKKSGEEAAELRGKIAFAKKPAVAAKSRRTVNKPT